MRKRRLQGALQALLVVALAGAGLAQVTPSPVRAQASEAGQSDYDGAVAIFLQEMRLGNYAEAYAAMRRAHGIDPNARTERGLGIAAFELKRYVASLLHLRAALADDRKPLTPEMRAEVEQLIERVETYVERVSVQVDPPGAKVFVDGAVPTRDEEGRVLLTVGEHELTASLPGYKVSSVKVHADGASSPTVSLRLSPLPAGGDGDAVDRAPARAPRDEGRSVQRTWGFVTLGAAGLFAVGAGAALGVRESAAATYNSDECAPMPSTQCADEADTVDTMETLMVVSGGVAAAALIGGLVLVLTADDDAPDAGATLGCAAAPLGVHCAGRF